MRSYFALTASTLLLLATTLASAQTVKWKGYTWKVATGGIGGGVVTGNVANVRVDASDALHLSIAKIAAKWTGAELFTQSNQGFGTYQWILQGDNFYDMEPQIVLGLFTYGPAGGIGVDGETRSTLNSLIGAGLPHLRIQEPISLPTQPLGTTIRIQTRRRTKTTSSFPLRQQVRLPSA